MGNKNETHAEIVAEARDRYTVHDCNECNWRKCCYLNARGFDSDECRKKRQSIALLFGIEDEYFAKLLCRLEAAHEREIDEKESVIQAVESARTSEVAKLKDEIDALRKANAELAKLIDIEKMPPLNMVKAREALVQVKKNIAHLCGYLNAPGSLVAGRMEINGIINAALAAPARRFELFATANEAMVELKRRHSICAKENRPCLEDCPDCGTVWCSIAWLYSPIQDESEAAK